MTITQLFTLTLLTTSLLLGGCGRAVSPTAATRAGLMSASDTVGLPSTYRPGVPFAGSEGTPSLRTTNFPKYARDAKGTQSDPVNLMIAGSERQLRHVFGSMGWVEADKINPVTVAKTIKAGLTNGDYPTSPMSDLYLYNRTQDIAYQKNAVSVRARDHLRVWKTPLMDHLGRNFWAIAATKDVSIKFGPGDKLPTHAISPDIDDERQLVVDDFLSSGQVAMRYTLDSLGANFKGQNGTGDLIFSDGRVEVLELRLMK